MEVTDVNDDKRPDLVIRKMELPDIAGAIDGLEFTLTHLVFFGEGKAFARKPAVDEQETYDEEELAGAIQNYELVADCSGDGIADLVALDLQGRVTIPRVLFEKGGFFSADSWKVERTPWKVFQSPGSATSLRVQDLNGDGLGDLVSTSEDQLHIMLSRRTGGRR